MKLWAKLFEIAGVGQVLALLDENEDGEPVVKFLYEKDEFGRHSFTFGFPKTEMGWTKAQAFLNTVDEQSAEQIIKQALTMFSNPNRKH